MSTEKWQKSTKQLNVNDFLYLLYNIQKNKYVSKKIDVYTQSHSMYWILIQACILAM